MHLITQWLLRNVSGSCEKRIFSLVASSPHRTRTFLIEFLFFDLILTREKTFAHEGMSSLFELYFSITYESSKSKVYYMRNNATEFEDEAYTRYTQCCTLYLVDKHCLKQFIRRHPLWQCFSTPSPRKAVGEGCGLALGANKFAVIPSHNNCINFLPSTFLFVQRLKCTQLTWKSQKFAVPNGIYTFKVVWSAA